jgi:hypothetical protein
MGLGLKRSHSKPLYQSCLYPVLSDFSIALALLRAASSSRNEGKNNPHFDQKRWREAEPP